jgi:uncharacterized protein YqgC (DUF456 family)
VAILLTILGLLLALVGLVGCILPTIPGPPLGFLALIVLSIAKDWEPFSLTFLVIMAGLTIGVSGLDYVVPAASARKYGGSKYGVWGSIIGMLIGLLFFPPWGMLIGTMAGALVGELTTGRDRRKALRAGWGVLVGTIVAIGVKLAFSGFILFFYLKALF